MHFINYSTSLIAVLASISYCLAAPVPDVANVAPPASVEAASFQATSPYAPQMRSAIDAGVDEIDDGDDNMKALVQGMATCETSFGVNMPTEANQKEIGKWGTPAQEMGPLRLNKYMLQELGYSEQDMEQMNALTTEGVEMTSQAVVKGIREWGFDNFMNYQRGGLTRFQSSKDGTLSNADKEDTESLVGCYRQVQKAILDSNSINSNSQDIYYSSIYTVAI